MSLEMTLVSGSVNSKNVFVSFAGSARTRLLIVQQQQQQSICRFKSTMLFHEKKKKHFSPFLSSI